MGNLTIAELRSAGIDIAAVNNVAFDSREPGRAAVTPTPQGWVPIIHK